jgi:hypothetical protein
VNGFEHGLLPHAFASLSGTQCVLGNDGFRSRTAVVLDDVDRVARASPGWRGRSTSIPSAAEASDAPHGTPNARGDASGVSGEAGDDEASPVAVPSGSGRVGDAEASRGTSPSRHVATFAGDGASRASAWCAVAPVIARARAVRVSARTRFRACAPAGTPGGRARRSAGTSLGSASSPLPVRNGRERIFWRIFWMARVRRKNSRTEV